MAACAAQGRWSDRGPASDMVPEVASAIDPEAVAKFQRKILKLQKISQERVHWPALDKEMLSLQPRLWMEVLDQQHRYATLLYDYWRRWQLSDTRDYFFNWLDNGQGSMIDLPHAPRRLLDEWKVIYLRRDQQPLFRIRIEAETGRFVWEADGTPVTIPLRLPRAPDSAGCCVTHVTDRSPPATPREAAVAQIVHPLLEKACRRDMLLAAARAEVEAAIREGVDATRERLVELAEPLIEEGLLCQLRDPYFVCRQDAATKPGGHAHLREMPRLPRALLPDVTWEDFLKAIDHDEGLHMKTPFQRGDARADGKGIFVLDHLGSLYSGTKIRGVFHHSSFVRGHCVKVAGGICIVDGWLQQLSPHSGHYQPGKEHVEEMISDWKDKGVDFSNVEVKPFVKTR